MMKLLIAFVVATAMGHGFRSFPVFMGGKVGVHVSNSVGTPVRPMERALMQTCTHPHSLGGPED